MKSTRGRTHSTVVRSYAHLGNDAKMATIILETLTKFLPDATPVTLPEEALQPFKSAGQSHFLDEKQYSFTRYYREVGVSTV